MPNFIDTARITVRAGAGGNGAVAFHTKELILVKSHSFRGQLAARKLIDWLVGVLYFCVGVP